jgi:iron complex outermembrane recepter protein
MIDRRFREPVNAFCRRPRDRRAVKRTPVLLAIAALAAARTAAADPAVRALKELSVDQLLDLEVISVSKRSEPLAAAPASIYVITSEALRRSGATTLPEALRLAPNLQVARIDAAQYAISARGFNNAIGNKLLVLVDGRTVYTPLFSGVFWDQQDVLLQDVERIEVISGPGATLWGANAVNGVINVITRAAQDTTGTLVVAGGGDAERGGAVRFGSAFEDGAFRVYARYSELDATRRAGNISLDDAWRRAQAGFRADWKRGADTFTLQGDAYDGEAEHRGFVGAFELTAIAVSGANLLGRWQRVLAGGSELRLQVYADHTERDDALFYRPTADIADLDFQHEIAGARHHVLWGGGYRYGRDDIEAGFVTIFVPSSRSLSWGNLFVQDDIALRDSLSATVGVKLESNDYTGVEVLPSLRLAWQPAPGTLLWGSLSRAVRAPARYDRDVRFPGFPPYLVVGGPDFKSEVANVIELGYRAQPASTLNFSLTAFAHLWDDIRSGTAIPVRIENKIEGEIVGLEAWAEYRPFASWLLSAGGTIMEDELRLERGSTDPVGVDNNTLRNDPDYVASLRSRFDLPAGVQLDVTLRHTARLPAPVVPAYTELDTRIAWQRGTRLELSLVGRNLLHGSHPEYGDAASRAAIERSFFGQIQWQF